MKSFLLPCLGVGFLVMSETSVAETGRTLVLETSQGQVKIKLLPDVAPNHVARITELAEQAFMTVLSFTVLFLVSWRKLVIQQAQVWVDRAKI